MASPRLFVEYIGAQGQGVMFSDVPIDDRVDFHFICSFAIDYTNTTNPTQTDGEFGVFWDTHNLTPNAVAEIKAQHPNVRVAVSLGGYSVNGDHNEVKFNATSVDSWVRNAVKSLTNIIEEYRFDGIDINYENFSKPNDTDTFTECIGQLITTLKERRVISFVSIAPYADPTVERMYEALWASYSKVIDYVNFQFYASDVQTTVDQYVQSYNQQVDNYPGGQVLASFLSDPTRPTEILSHIGFSACIRLRQQNRLSGIFIWSADSSKRANPRFPWEIMSQELLAAP